MRACIQEILAKYKAQGITGVRFQFFVNDALSIPVPPYDPTTATIRPQWVTEVTDFFQDLYNYGIYHVIPMGVPQPRWYVVVNY